MTEAASRKRGPCGGAGAACTCGWPPGAAAGGATRAAAAPPAAGSTLSVSCRISLTFWTIESHRGFTELISTPAIAPVAEGALPPAAELAADCVEDVAVLLT